MNYGFKNPFLSPSALEQLKILSREARGDILRMTTLARSGHPGGSLSSIDFYMTVYSCAAIYPKDPGNLKRDRILVSHGHTSPGVYAALANLGFLPRKKVVALFRKTGSLYEGHVERTIPGVDWSSGNLGQGLAAGCGFAIAIRHLKLPSHVFVLMSDAEQAKGQVAEARRIAVKHGLNNITVVVDYNHIQLSGRLDDIMPQNIRENYLADGWDVVEADGHNHADIYAALRKAVQSARPTVVLARTVMGKGISFMEDDYEYHGKALKEDEYLKAMEELGLDADLEPYRKLRDQFKPEAGIHAHPPLKISMDPGVPSLYQPDEKKDNRSAFGRALKDLADVNEPRSGNTPIIVFDCDLVGSVKTDAFSQAHQKSFYQNGVQEHATATMAGAASSQGVQAFFADFGVFSLDETYNQHRLNDINATNLKVIGTHLGLNVGEDGKTHQCIDYLGLTRSIPGFKTIIPADPNQTDRVVRWVACQPGNFFIGMGRSSLPVITHENGAPYFDKDYKFNYGKADLLRRGDAAAIFTYGSTVGRALEAWERLSHKGIKVSLYNVACPNDLDPEMIEEAAATGRIIVFEDHLSVTGLAASASFALCALGRTADFQSIGVRGYAPSGAYDEVYDVMGLSVENLVDRVQQMLADG